jgi:hypothetical protein
MQVNYDEMYPSRYLRHSDLGGREARVTINDVTTELVGGERKNIMAFAGKNKQLVLNKTNANTIMRAYGKQTDEWIGKDIILFATTVDFRGESVPGIRVKVPTQSKRPTQDDGLNDEIPPFSA